MADWIDVADQSDFLTTDRKVVDVDGAEVLVINLNGEFFAIEDSCTHDHEEISSGTIEGDEIICPRHGARFCIKTGAFRSAPAYEDIPVFPVRVEQGKIQIKS